MIQRFKDKDMQVVIGLVLRTGVFISMAVVFIGGVIYLKRHGQSIANYHKFVGVPDFIHSPGGIINGIINLRGRAIIQAGIVLLIATPIVRVMFSAVGFILEKDHLYTAITFIVLLIIIISAFSGHAG
ncbi:putative membrane protein [Mucilaginibacter sp. UYNi724]